MDAFDEVLDEALDAGEERADDIDILDDEPEPEESGGGDIDVDDRPTPIDRASEASAKLEEARVLREQWQAEHDHRQAALKAAQDAFKEVRRKVMEGNATDDDELAAQDAVLEARYAVDKARDSLGQAVAWHDAVAAAPKLAPAQQAWLDANPQYSTDVRFQKQAQAVMKALADEGMDPSHQNFYRKLDQRMRQTPRMGTNSRKTPGAPAVRTGGSKSEPAMTQKEAAFISRLGYDPRDKRVAAQWRESKANTKRIAARRGI